MKKRCPIFKPALEILSPAHKTNNCTRPMQSKKIILTGNMSVGKSSLFNRFINDQFDDRYITTIGVKVNKKDVDLLGGGTASLVVWDVAGEVTQDKVPSSYFLGAHGVILVFDVTRPVTYRHLASDLEHLRKLLPFAVIRVVGNKKDLLTDTELEDILRLAPVRPDLLTSAKTGESVEALFAALAAEIG